MSHVPLDRAFKCARLDASYICLSCRLKANSSRTESQAIPKYRRGSKADQLANPRIQTTARPVPRGQLLQKSDYAHPGALGKRQLYRVQRQDVPTSQDERAEQNDVPARRIKSAGLNVFRKHGARYESQLIEDQQTIEPSDLRDSTTDRPNVFYGPTLRKGWLISYEAGRGNSFKSSLQDNIKSKSTSAYNSRALRESEEYSTNFNRTRSQQAHKTQYGSRKLPKVRARSRTFHKHEEKDDVRDQIRKNAKDFNPNNISRGPTTYKWVPRTDTEELNSEDEFFEVLDAHNSAALEDSGEGLKSWDHLEADGELDEAPSTYQPFSADVNGASADGAFGLGETETSTSMFEDSVAPLQNTTPYTHSASTIRPQHPSLHGNLDSFIKRTGIATFASLRSNGAAHLGQSSLRLFHTSTRSHQGAAAATTEAQSENRFFEFPATTSTPNKYSHIRQQLRQWQEDHGNPREDTKPQPSFDTDDNDADGMMNSMTRLPDMNAVNQQSAAQDEEERSAASQMPTTDSRDGMISETADTTDTTFLSAGDLVELEYTASERNSVLAIFVRRIPGADAQFFTMQGRWIFMREKKIMWSLPNWASKSDLEPLIEHLPNPRDPAELEEMLERAQVEDLSVPRSASGPLVKRLVNFWTETQEIYRKNASVLDNAHNLLAHESDLRYGSLVSASSTLLQIPARDLPVTALYAVRTALARAPLAFSIDRRSHRMTGYLQIRSKETVRMIQYVREWIRDWQDDVAAKAQDGGKTHGPRKHKTTKGAGYIHSFLDKARHIILKSRENRDVLPFRNGNIGISKKRFPMSEDSSAVRITTDTQFTEHDLEIIRFIEAWCASGTLYANIAYSSLPPMLLQATGLYEQFEILEVGTGFTFLQELGVLLPYENRIRFDPHLLLPSSQHSKPLQNLMDNLIKMQHNHQFRDSMQGLRRDWGSLPVFCVDDAGAQEIDDGVSIEAVEGRDDEYWLHTHVANPTAFFERDHSLAKMARHMGESIYMPERAYMMLPRWATSRHFSLAKDRPCITFSTRVGSNGDILERRVTPGIIRNVISLTPREVTSLLGEKDKEMEKIVLTVGGEAPPPPKKTSMIDSVTEEMKQSLLKMKTLADKLSDRRLKRGGIFFDNHETEIAVWQNSKGQGLAWDHPWRRGSRTVEGDPVIQLKTPGLTNWFAPQVSAGNALVREMMLLAGETAATWCSDRGIPTIFRGTVRRPDSPDADAFYRQVVAPAIEEQGEIPLYLGIRYFSIQGASTLRTTAFPHKVSGLEQYAKTTSPLRRYGDMIVHWQIEAALREEARLGRNLTPVDTKRDASFLPFSSNVLQTIMLGLAPRENLISKAKGYANDFWIAMLLFRAHHFGECELPFAATHAEHVATGKPMLRMFMHTANTTGFHIGGTATQLKVSVTMSNPLRAGLGEARRGDTWEVELEYVDVYKRNLIAKPYRLVDRPVDDRLELWRSVVP